jgi:serine protease Do
MRAKNGWYAIIVGPVHAKSITEARASLGTRIEVPSDAYLAKTDGFLDLVFEAPPSPILASANYRGEAPSVARVGPLTVVLNSFRSNDGLRVPLADLRLAGANPFRVTIANKMGLDAGTFSRAKLLRLDPSTDVPQVVLTFYTGGAHCCTITRIATRSSAGFWSVIDGLMLDSDDG